jgi:hypothetical protein
MVALGVYVPALSLKKQLEARGESARLLCLEELYTDREAVMEETKKSFHQSFRLAKLSYRVPVRNKTAIDPLAQDSLMEELKAERYDAIIAFSGFWADVLNRLMQECPWYENRIHAVHMDAVLSLSWKGADLSGFHEIWQFQRSTHQILCSIEPCEVKGACENRILVHGGGWGIGEYAEKIRTLNELGIPLDLIVYYPEEADAADTFNAYYLLDPDWKPQDHRDEYPRLLQFDRGEWKEAAGNRREENPVRALIRKDAAILSKPGGGTLCDSLVTGTPLIFSEELAYYEKENRLMWIENGLGIEYESFVRSAERTSLLQTLCTNLQKAGSGLPAIADLLE